jgi:hypothetical protein
VDGFFQAHTLHVDVDVLFLFFNFFTGHWLQGRIWAYVQQNHYHAS